MQIARLSSSQTRVLLVTIVLSFLVVFLIERQNGLSQYVNDLSRNVGNIYETQDQHTYINEDMLDDAFLIPSDEELKTYNETELTAIYWRYMNSIQVLCRNVFRFGSFKDGGKEICVDRDFRPVKPCLVYSFGSGFKYDFELSIKAALGCEIHTFDPTIKVDKNWKAPDHVTFHKIGLAGTNHVTKENWQMKTLETIRKDLGHESKTIDVLKMDIGGFEWSVIEEAYHAGTLRLTKQLAIETHFTPNAISRSKSAEYSLRVLRLLYDEGFRICMRDRNVCCLKELRTEFNVQYTNLNELTLINTRFKTTK